MSETVAVLFTVLTRWLLVPWRGQRSVEGATKRGGSTVLGVF